MRPLVLAVWQTETASDPSPALATLPDAKHYVVRAPDLVGAVPAAVHLLAASCADRESVGAAVRRACPDAVVVVLEADQRLSPDLAAALGDLGSESAPAEYRARASVRFLGREVSGGTRVVAWAGSPGANAPTRMLPGRLTTLAGSVTASIARLERAARRAALTGAPVRCGDLLWRPAMRFAWRLGQRARDGMPGLILSVLEGYGEVLTAAKKWERTRLPPTRPTLRGAGGETFERLETHRGWLLIRAGLDQRLVDALAAATPDHVAGERLFEGGRGGVWVLPPVSGVEAVLRWYRRGGAFRRLLRDRYFGWRRPRPVRELMLTAAARHRGVPTPEVLGARVDRVGAGFYRGALLSRRIGDASTLGGLLLQDLPIATRAAVLEAVGRTIREMHDQGVHHRDLNATNVLVGLASGRPVVSLIDFDRAALRVSVPAWLRRRALRRLARSLAKLGGGAARIEDDCRVLGRAYWGSA